YLIRPISKMKVFTHQYATHVCLLLIATSHFHPPAITTSLIFAYSVSGYLLFRPISKMKVFTTPVCNPRYLLFRPISKMKVFTTPVCNPRLSVTYSNQSFSSACHHNLPNIWNELHAIIHLEPSSLLLFT
ncbi:hypothetical protein J6590_095879, partial [Homalodisca vitripennis]